MKVYLVVKVLSDDGKNWEIQGVFSTEQKGIEACYKDNHCLFELNMDELLPDETIEAGGWYPRLEEKPA